MTHIHMFFFWDKFLWVFVLLLVKYALFCLIALNLPNCYPVGTYANVVTDKPVKTYHFLLVTFKG